MNGSVLRWFLTDYHTIMRACRLSTRELKRAIGKRLRKLLGEAREVPFYSQHMRAAAVECGDRDSEEQTFHVLRALPLVSKSALRDAGTAVLRGGRPCRTWHSSRSSGSTGEPFLVYYDSRSWATLKYLVKLRARAACGVRVWHRVTVLDAIAPEQERQTAFDKFVGLNRISVLRPGSEIAARLAELAPDFVYGLPSALLEVASQMGRDAMELRLKAIFTSGELLSSNIRSSLRSAFGCPLHDVYGTSETKEIAWECSAGTLHVNSDVVLVEILDDEGSEVPVGAEGEIVTTLLVNTAMPLIRYKTGDRGIRTSRRCECGVSFPSLGVVTGREADVVQLSHGHRISPYALTCAVERVTGVCQYQVTQVERSGFVVRAVLEGGIDPIAAGHGIVSAVTQVVPSGVSVNTEIVDRIPSTPGKKFRVVIPLGG